MTIQELLAGLETESNEKLKVVVFNVEDGEIAVYTRSDIDLEEYRGWENLRVAFWGVNGDRVIIHTAVRERQPATKPPRMTCREWMAEHYPSAIDEDFNGGVYGCPWEYKELKSACKSCKEKARGLNETQNEQCRKCWDQPVPEGVEG